MNKVKCEELLKEFSANADKMFESLESLNIVEAMERMDSAKVNKSISLIRDMLVSVIPYGLPVPKVFLYVSSMSNNGKSISMVTITVSSKASSEKNYHFTYSLVGDNCEKKAYEFLKSVYVALVEDEILQVNVDIINSVLSQAVSEVGHGYSIHIVTPLGNNGKKIVKLTDDEVVFVADTDRVLGIEDMVIFHSEPDEFVSEEKIQGAYAGLCNALSKAQTTVQLVGMHGGDLISLLCDISRRVKPMTMISKVYSKKINAIKGDRSGIGYYNKDDVFAVVSKNEGAFELVLSPISTKTLEPVDVDVIGELQM